LIINLGTSEAVARWVPQFKEEDDAHAKIYTLVTLDIIKNLIGGIIVCALLYIFRNEWSSAFSVKNFTSNLAIPVCGIIFFRAITGPQENFLSLNYQQPFLNRRRMIITILNIMLFYLVYYTWGISVLSMLYISLVSTVVAFFLVGWKYLFSPQFTLRLSFGLKILQGQIHGIIRYSFSMWLNQIANHFTSQRGQEYFIQLILGEKVFGLYALGKKLTILAEEVLLPKSLKMYAGTNGYEILKRDGMPALKRFIDKFASFIWLTQGTMTIACIILMPYILNLLYGIKDNFSIFYIQSVFFSLVILRPVGIYEYYITVVKKPSWFLMAQTVLFPLAFVSYPLLIRKLGLFGALLGLVLLTNSALLFYFIKLRGHVESPFRWEQYLIYLTELATVLAVFSFYPQHHLMIAIPLVCIAIGAHLLIFRKFKIFDFGSLRFGQWKTEYLAR
jgi:O-antigen/teichoic acid export membrane protein